MSKYRDFYKAREYVRSLNFNNTNEWFTAYDAGKIPSDIPKYPNETKAYEKLFDGYPDWIGTAFLDFIDARKFARTLKLTSPGQWRVFAASKKRPENIPQFPDSTYKGKGWIDFPDFLGYEKFDFKKLNDDERRENYLKYIKWARDFYLKNTCNGRTDFLKKTREKGVPKDFTLAPLTRYRKFGFKWELITGNEKKGRFAKLSIDELRELYEEYKIWARDIHKKNNFTGSKAFEKYTKNIDIPKKFPNEPVKVFSRLKIKNFWADCLELSPDRIGTKRNLLSYEKSIPVIRRLVKEKNLKTLPDYNRIKREPDFPVDLLPYDPYSFFGDQFPGIEIWYGIGDKSRKIANYEFWEAKKIYQKIAQEIKLFTSVNINDAWLEYAVKNNKDPRLPNRPEQYYRIKNVKARFKGIKDISKLQPGIDYFYDIYDTFGIEDPQWSSNKIIKLLTSFLEDDFLQNVDTSILIALLEEKNLFNINSKFSNLIKLLPGNHKKEEFTKFIKEVLKQKRGDVVPDTTQFELGDDYQDYEKEVEPNDEYEQTTQKDSYKPQEILSKPHVKEPSEVFASAQKAYELRTNRVFNIKDEHLLNDDTDFARFLVRKYVNQLWHDCFLNEEYQISKIKKDKVKGDFAKEIRNKFLQEYEETKSLIIPEEYQFSDQPTLMQRYFACMVKNKKYYANFSGTGAGKTIASILASRICNSKTTLIICPNGVVTQWAEVISNVFPKYAKNIFLQKKAFFVEPSNEIRYLIINYDQFQLGESSKKRIQQLTRNKIDFVIIDEIHFTKTTKEDDPTKRRETIDTLLSLINENNPDAKITGLSATPVVNNLVEGRSLLEMLSGQQWNAEIGSILNVKNAIKLHSKFALMSIREEPDYQPPKIETSSVNAVIPDDFIIKDLNHDKLAIEQFCTEARLPKIIEIIKKTKGKTVIYTEFVQSAIKGKPGVVDILFNGLTKAGFNCTRHTGDDHSGKDAFVNDPKVDVLIATQTISTGVDNLQKVCHNMIFNTLPWTHSMYAQIIGRLVRRRQENKVTIHHILANVEYDGKSWVFDERRLDAITRKKSILDCVLTGDYPDKHLTNPNQVYIALREFISRIREGKRLDLMRPYRIYDLTPAEIKRREKKYGDFSTLNRKLIMSTSDNNLKTIQKNPELWYAYHGGLNNNKKNWPYDPLDEWIMRIKKMPKSTKIADFGCGEAVLGRMFGKDRVHSFDFHADDPKLVHAGNMKKVPLRANSVSIVVFNLSIMGTDWPELVKEGVRVLKEGGMMFIADTQEHLKGYLKNLVPTLEEFGMSIFKFDQKREPFFMISAIKDFKI